MAEWHVHVFAVEIVPGEVRVVGERSNRQVLLDPRLRKAEEIYP
jgi:hypothetical protein